MYRCVSILSKGSSYRFINPKTSFQHNFSCNIRVSKFNQELYHLSYRSSALTSQNVGKSCSIPGLRHFSSHASKEQKSQKMLLYLTGLVFAMVGCTYAAVPLYRRFCQATGYGGTVTRREVCLCWFTMVFWIFIKTWYFFLILTDNNEISHFYRRLKKRLLDMIAIRQSPQGVNFFFLIGCCHFTITHHRISVFFRFMVIRNSYWIPQQFWKKKKIIISLFLIWWFKLLELLCVPSFILGICMRWYLDKKLSKRRLT